MAEQKTIESALKKVEAQQENFGFMKLFDVEEHWEVRKALEKQIAKKVIVPPCNVCHKKYCDPMCGYVSKSFVDDFKCPTCGSDRVYITEYGVMHDYCPNCGQKLDWSDV